MCNAKKMATTMTTTASNTTTTNILAQQQQQQQTNQNRNHQDKKKKNKKNKAFRNIFCIFSRNKIGERVQQSEQQPSTGEANLPSATTTTTKRRTRPAAKTTIPLCVADTDTDITDDTDLFDITEWIGNDVHDDDCSVSQHDIEYDDIIDDIDECADSIDYVDDDDDCSSCVSLLSDFDSEEFSRSFTTTEQTDSAAAAGTESLLPTRQRRRVVSFSPTVQIREYYVSYVC